LGLGHGTLTVIIEYELSPIQLGDNMDPLLQQVTDAVTQAGSDTASPQKNLG
jgi:hypothetical protein